MAVLEITARDFRNKLKDCFNLVDKGQRVVIKRGSEKSYLLVPIDVEDVVLSSEMELKLERSIEQIKEGKSTTVKSVDELNKFLESL
ncbi:hypothetical protein [Myroides guanonis]|uniref:Antitoxin n=1 Tax=Myroides guanonis TaxID=1150112 RepID=A0A1I3LLL3_9FLAO|nr:hypothetical protein [Myroides guanonis]SFI85430.1 hypothetical protein SAMN04487893_101380 [Myroides guanonis]